MERSAISIWRKAVKCAIGKALWVSGDFFNVLGVQPSLGRVLNASDDVRACTAPGVVISHGFWQKEFGGAADVVGRRLTLADHSLEVVGVTPPEFYGLEVGKSFDFAVPICAEALLRGKNSRLDSGTNWWLMVTGRLKPGESLPQANASLQSMSAGLFEASLPANYPEASIKDYLCVQAWKPRRLRLAFHYCARTTSGRSGCYWLSPDWFC